MAIINLFGYGLSGKSKTVTAQTHVNLYAEITQENERSSVAFYGTPGLTLLTTFGDTPIRGWIVVGDFIYLVHLGTFWRVNNAGVQTSLGTIPTTTGRVSFAYNGTQIAFIDSGAARLFVFTVATSTLVTVTTNVIGTPIDITFQDGYGLLAYSDGKFQKTAAYAFQTLNALEYATAEANPDNLYRIIANNGEIVLAGTETLEFWGNTGAADFPYANQRGTTLEYGLAAAWSFTKFDQSLIGLFKNRMGQVQVMLMAGHAVKKVSSLELDYLINSYSGVSDATGFAYMLGGHPMYQINFSSVGKSWLYDGSTDMWTSMQFGLAGARHRGELQVDFLNKPRIADYSTGDIYTMAADTYTDNGTTILREITTRHAPGGGDRIAVHKLQVNFAVGVGLDTGQGSNPQAMLQVSKDSGKSWGNELWASMGAVGAGLTRVIWRRLGSSFEWTFRIRVTDPVKVVITSASLDTDRRP